jgi:membrane fusion protein (multidrug efflux system)
MTDTPTAAPGAKRARKRAFIILALVVVAAGGAWAVNNFLLTANTESTDDAYVGGDVVQVTSELPGAVLAIHADDTETVKTGQTLIDLDPADAEVAMESAKAGLAQSVHEVRALLAQADQLRAQVAGREADLKRAQDDSRRRAALIATGAVSKEDFAHAQDVTAVQEAALAAARAQLDETVARIGATPIARQPDVLTAAAKLRNAALALRRTTIVAPTDGIVARRTAQVGQHVEAGSPLMAVVPLADVWIDANFKEVQLQRMRVGQPAIVHADIYGSHVAYRAKVAGIAAGSGNAFALLPAQNATGNWIKIVQRLPVRILIEPGDLAANPLRIGLSAAVDVDVTDTSGPLIATDVRNQPFPAKRSNGDDPAIDTLIAKIIADNGGAPELASAGTR